VLRACKKEFFEAIPHSRRRYPASELGECGTSMSAMDSVDESILLEVDKQRLHHMYMYMGPSSTLPSSTLTLTPSFQQEELAANSQSSNNTIFNSSSNNNNNNN
jgi:hypothetical protein